MKEGLYYRVDGSGFMVRSCDMSDIEEVDKLQIIIPYTQEEMEQKFGQSIAKHKKDRSKEKE